MTELRVLLTGMPACWKLWSESPRLTHLTLRTVSLLLLNALRQQVFHCLSWFCEWAAVCSCAPHPRLQTAGHLPGEAAPEPLPVCSLQQPSLPDSSILSPLSCWPRGRCDVATVFCQPSNSAHGPMDVLATWVAVHIPPFPGDGLGPLSYLSVPRFLLLLH